MPAGEHNALGEASLALSKVQALLFESCRLYFCLNIAVWHLPFSQLHAIVAERSACDPRPPILWFLFCTVTILAIVPSLLLVQVNAQGRWNEHLLHLPLPPNPLNVNFTLFLLHIESVR